MVKFQERLVYVPMLPGIISRAYHLTPASFRRDYEDASLRAADGVRLAPRMVRQALGPLRQVDDAVLQYYSSKKMLALSEQLYIAHRLEFVDIKMQKLHCNVFMLSYRGYGESDGNPSQHGIILDAQAALDHLVQRKDIDTSRIVVFGRSLGGAVGSVLAKNNPAKIAALILGNTFTSILDMARIKLLYLKWFIGGSMSNGPKVLNFVVRSPWNTIDTVGKIKQPILFLSGLQDKMVPPSQMHMLYSKARETNKHCIFVDFSSGRHMNTWVSGGQRYWRKIQLFLNQFNPEDEEYNLDCKDGDEKAI